MVYFVFCFSMIVVTCIYIDIKMNRHRDTGMPCICFFRRVWRHDPCVVHSRSVLLWLADRLVLVARARQDNKWVCVCVRVCAGEIRWLNKWVDVCVREMTWPVVCMCTRDYPVIVGFLCDRPNWNAALCRICVGASHILGMHTHTLASTCCPWPRVTEWTRTR